MDFRIRIAKKEYSSLVPNLNILNKLLFTFLGTIWLGK